MVHLDDMRSLNCSLSASAYACWLGFAWQCDVVLGLVTSHAIVIGEVRRSANDCSRFDDSESTW